MAKTTETPVELKFCDLCGVSIPLKDLEAGLARTAEGRTVGACCLAKLVPAQQGGSSKPAGPRPAGGLPVFAAGVVIAAVAGAAWFVDSRAVGRDRQQAVEDLTGKVAAFETVLAQQSARIAESRDKALAGVLGKMQAAIDEVRTSITALRGALPKRDGGMVKVTGKLAELTRQLRDLSATQSALRERMTTSFAALSARFEEVVGGLRDDRRKSRARNPAGADPVARAPSKKIPSLPDPLGKHVDMLAKGDAGERWSAVDELIRSGDKRVVPYLVPALTDDDPFVRRLSAEGIGQLGNKQSCGMLISALEDKEAIVREAAFKALVKLSSKRMPFDPEASEVQRRTMVKRWRQWWDKEKKG